MSRKSNICNALPIVAAHYGEKFGVKVVIGGSDAATDGSTILVPNVPEEHPNKNIVWGYLTHEAAHVRHTDFSVWESVAEGNALRSTLLNVLEDVRIERLMLEQFPGVRADLDATVLYLKESGRFETVSEIDQPGRVLQAKIMYWLRANVLAQPVNDLAESTEIAMQKAFTEGVNTRLGVLLRKAVSTLSTADCLDLTDLILKMLSEEAEKEEEKAQDEQSSDADSNSMNSDSDTPRASSSVDQTDQDADGSSNSTESGSDQSSVDGVSGSEMSTGDLSAEHIRRALASGHDDLDQDAFECLKDELCQEADVNGDGSYCTVPTAPTTGGNYEEGRELLDKVQSTTSKLRSQLMGIVQSARLNRDHARRNGRRLDSKRITRIVSGDTRIFRQREERKQANTAVHVLTDLSASMIGNQEQIAREASLAIALALESIPGVSPAVTYFCGYSNDPVRSAVRHGQSVKRNTHHFFEVARGRTPMAEGLWYAAFELSKMIENRKLLIVITDGDPDNTRACHTVINLCREAEIEMVGIGVGHPYIQELFDRSIVINSIDDLRSTLFQLMRDKLTIDVA